MHDETTEIDAIRLVNRCETALPTERLKMRPEVDRLIRTLAAHHLPVPIRLRQLKTRLEDEAYEDMFDNMPV